MARPAVVGHDGQQEAVHSGQEVEEEELGEAGPDEDASVIGQKCPSIAGTVTLMHPEVSSRDKFPRKKYMGV